MNFVKIMRFLISWVIALILLVLTLPHIGVQESHFMPPARVYSNATGKAIGIVTFKKSVANSNPFRTLERVNTIDYKFQAPPPITSATSASPAVAPAATDPATDKAAGKKGKKAKQTAVTTDSPEKPTKLVTYMSTAQVDGLLYDTTEKNMSVPVRYEKTFPEINGIDSPKAGQACVGPNVIMSWDWLKWVALSLVLATGIMLIIDRIGRPQDLH